MAVAPKEDEEEQLEAELKLLENSETLSVTTSQLNEMLYEGDASVRDMLVACQNTSGRALPDRSLVHRFACGGEIRRVIVEELAKSPGSTTPASNSIPSASMRSATGWVPSPC